MTTLSTLSTLCWRGRDIHGTRELGGSRGGGEGVDPGESNDFCQKMCDQQSLLLLFNYLQLAFNLLRTILEEDAVSESQIGEIILDFQKAKDGEDSEATPSQSPNAPDYFEYCSQGSGC